MAKKTAMLSEIRSSAINYPALTGLRAIAAWMVFIHHSNPFKPDVAGKFISHFFDEFHVGVTIFFVLSGFLITLRYYDQADRTRLGFYNYMVNRFARIWPPLFLVALINFAWIAATDWRDFLATITFVRGFFADFNPHYIPQTWSLTTEECFYVLAPMIFLVIRKKRAFRFFLPAFFIGLGLVITAVFVRYPFEGFFRDYRFLFNFTFFGRCMEFFCGIGAALVLRRMKMPVKKAAGITLFSIAAIAASIAGLALLHRDDHYGDYFIGGMIINNLLLPFLGIAPLLYALCTESNFLQRLLATRPVIILGKSSYIFYLIHLGFFSDWFQQFHFSNTATLFIWLNIVSVILYFVFEKPVNSFLRDRLRIVPSEAK